MHIKAILAILFGLAAFFLIRGILKSRRQTPRDSKGDGAETSSPLLIADGSQGRDRQDSRSDESDGGADGGDGGGGGD
jgi:hypothetical protein